MEAKKDHLTVSLQKSWQAAASGSLQSNQDVAVLMEALLEDRFKFVKEPWHGQNGKLAEELLLRAWDKKGIAISHAKAMNAIVDEGDLSSFNSFLVYKTFAKTPVHNHTSLSVNVFPSCVANQEFWDRLESSVGAHDCHNIIFEILEHEQVYRVDHGLMRTALDKGYRFALDDFEGTVDDHKRLQDFAPYLSFVKLDGKLVRDGMKDETALKQTISMLKTNYPDLKIIAEFVRNNREADKLYNMGVSAVQGMSLQKNFSPSLRP